MALPIRISDAARYGSLTPMYSSLLARQIEVQRQIASGMLYDSVSDNPILVGIAQRLHNEDIRFTQNLRNIDEAMAFSQVTESAMTSMVNLLQRAKELAVAGGDAAKSATDRAGLAVEVDGILQGMIELGSQQHRGRKLFSGTLTQTDSFTATYTAGVITGVTYNGNAEKFATEYAPGRTIDYNILGSGAGGLFVDTISGVNVFSTLIGLRDDLQSNPANLATRLQQVNDALQHTVATEANVGGVQSRLRAATMSHEDHQEVLAATLSKLENTDIAKAITELNALEMSYQAALATGARISQLSLVNYMR